MRTAILALFLVTGCASHSVLCRAPAGTSPGVVGTWVCKANGACTPDKTTDEARFNQSNTTQVTLPAECKTRIARILIQNAGSSDATVIVECAAPDTPIETTSLPGTP
jgi:hypothetical protein